ncbi:MAG TPA: hypothetical protein VGX71_09900 [Pseudaminobacter sp.]|nr:hypothetical protein [Pseudaminobacter sp.]
MQLLPGICATALVATLALPISLPANATPVFLLKAQTAQSHIIQIRDGVRWRRNFRGFRHHRHGFREHNGFWFPGGAFIAGAIIGSAIANSNNYYGGYDYEDRYYGRRYYADRYYGDRYYGESYANGRACSPRLDDAGKCRSFDSGRYGNYRRRVIILDR